MARSSTYSIVACDLERREWGVAVQSRFLAIGALAAWAEADVGAAATQSFTGEAALLVARRGGGYGGADIAIDLRVDDDPAPLQRDRRWCTQGGRARPALRLHADRPLAARRQGAAGRGADLETWAGIENLEERVEGAARIDPVVLAELRCLAAPPADATKPHTQEERDG